MCLIQQPHVQFASLVRFFLNKRMKNKIFSSLECYFYISVKPTPFQTFNAAVIFDHHVLTSFQS